MRLSPGNGKAHSEKKAIKVKTLFMIQQQWSERQERTAGEHDPQSKGLIEERDGEPRLHLLLLRR